MNTNQAPTFPDPRCHLCGKRGATRTARHISTRTTLQVCESQGCRDLVELAQPPAALQQRRLIG